MRRRLGTIAKGTAGLLSGLAVLSALAYGALVLGAVERPEGGIAYRTKGDANAHRDPWTIALPAQAGRTTVDVPYVGYALWYAKTREARTLLIVLVAVLTLSWLLRRIWSPRPAPETSSPAPPSPAATDGTPFWVEALTR